MDRLGGSSAILIRVRALMAPLVLLAAAALCSSLAEAAPRSQACKAVTPGTVAGEQRIALVMGNGAYRAEDSWQELPSVGKDADGMEVTLKDLGFGVIRGQDLDKNGMLDCILALKDTVKGARGRVLVVVYFSGHGIQAGGQNYLIPVGVRLPDRPEKAESDLFSLNYAMGQLGEAPERINLLVLDSCRSDPWVKGAGPRWKGSANANDAGFASMAAPEGTLIAYAAKPGTVASGIGGDNGTSLYTGKLLGNLKSPRLSLYETLMKTGTDVKVAANNTQTPWFEGDLSLLGGIVLKAGSPGPSAASVQPVPPPSPPQQVSSVVLLQPNSKMIQEPQLSQQVASVVPSPIVRESEAGAPSGVIMLKGRWKEPGSEFKDCADCPEMVVVPPGSFAMGSDASDNKRFYNEGPQHRVTIGRSFAVGKYAVTQAEWESVMGSNPSFFKIFKAPRNPVEQVSWNEVTKDFLPRLNARVRRTVLVSIGETGPYRLLTEAEWEYAARAGTATRYWWGDEVGTGNANCDGCSSRNNPTTTPVGSFRPNGFGLYDMNGNVDQWVQDCFVESYANIPADGSAAVEVDACSRIIRGGSWGDLPLRLRSARRSALTPDYHASSTGFRLARTLP